MKAVEIVLGIVTLYGLGSLAVHRLGGLIKKDDSHGYRPDLAPKSRAVSPVKPQAKAVEVRHEYELSKSAG